MARKNGTATGHAKIGFLLLMFPTIQPIPWACHDAVAGAVG